MFGCCARGDCGVCWYIAFAVEDIEIGEDVDAGSAEQAPLIRNHHVELVLPIVVLGVVVGVVLPAGERVLVVVLAAKRSCCPMLSGVWVADQLIGCAIDGSVSLWWPCGEHDVSAWRYNG